MWLWPTSNPVLIWLWRDCLILSVCDVTVCLSVTCAMGQAGRGCDDGFSSRGWSSWSWRRLSRPLARWWTPCWTSADSTLSCLTHDEAMDLSIWVSNGHHQTKLLSASCTSPWYNRTGWLGVKHQLTYLLASCTSRQWTSVYGSVMDVIRLNSYLPQARRGSHAILYNTIQYDTILYNTIQYNFIAKWNGWTTAGEVDKTEQLQRNVLTYKTTHKENEKHVI